jgi:hypothetical protein
MFSRGCPRSQTRPSLSNGYSCVKVSCWSAAVCGVESTRMTSGCRPTNSLAYLRACSMLAAAHRTCIRRFEPPVQPKSASACANAARKVVAPRSFSLKGVRTPIWCTRSCCARAASGHVTAEPSNNLYEISPVYATIPLEGLGTTLTKHSRLGGRGTGCLTG